MTDSCSLVLRNSTTGRNGLWSSLVTLTLERQEQLTESIFEAVTRVYTQATTLPPLRRDAVVDTHEWYGQELWEKQTPKQLRGTYLIVRLMLLHHK